MGEVGQEKITIGITHDNYDQNDINWQKNISNSIERKPKAFLLNHHRSNSPPPPNIIEKTINLQEENNINEEYEPNEQINNNNEESEEEIELRKWRNRENFIRKISVANMNYWEDIPQGYLYKKGDLGLVKTWKKRYFILLEGRILYFRSFEDFSSFINPKLQISQVNNEEKSKSELVLGYITISNILSVEIENETFFKIITPERIYLLKSDSVDLTNKWISLINQCKSQIMINQRTEHDLLLNISHLQLGYKEGWLLSKTGVIRIWKQRWFILKDGILFCFQEKENHSTAIKIPLYKSQVLNEDKKGFAYLIILIAGKTLKIRSEIAWQISDWYNEIMRQKVFIDNIITVQ